MPQMQQQQQQQRQQQQMQFRQIEKNVYDTTFDALEEHNHALQESQVRRFGIRFRDGEEMTEVKQIQQKIVDAMQRELPFSYQEIGEKARALIGDYEKLIEAADKYIASHKNPHTAIGKERLRLVQNTKRMASAEKERLPLFFQADRWEFFAENAGSEKITLGEMIGLIRGVSFDLDQIGEGTKAGEQTSELRVLQAGNETFYYKEDEKLTEPKEEFEKYYSKDKWKDEDRGIRLLAEELMVKGRKNMYVVESLIEDIVQQDFQAFKKAETDAELAAAFLPIAQALKKYFKNVDTIIDLEDTYTQRKLQELLSRLQVWTNRWFYAGNQAKIGEGESLSARNILTGRMASLLGVPSVVAKSNVAILHHSHKDEEVGIAMEQAKGVPHESVLERAKKSGKKVVYTPEAVRQFTCLQFLDTLCAQIDRHTNNRFVTVEEETEGYIKIGSVQGIDHDLSFGNRRFEVLKWGLMSLPAFMNKEQNGINLPVLDAEMVFRMLAMSKEGLFYCMGDLLGGENLDALWERWETLRNLLMEVLEREKDLPENKKTLHLVWKKEWTEQTVQEFQDCKSFYLFGRAEEAVSIPKEEKQSASKEQQAERSRLKKERRKQNKSKNMRLKKDKSGNGARKHNKQNRNRANKKGR